MATTTFREVADLIDRLREMDLVEWKIRNSPTTLRLDPPGSELMCLFVGHSETVRARGRYIVLSELKHYLDHQSTRTTLAGPFVGKGWKYRIVGAAKYACALLSMSDTDLRIKHAHACPGRIREASRATMVKEILEGAYPCEKK